MTAAHDDPAFAAVRAFADLPVLAGDAPLPPDAGLRTKLLQRDLERACAARDELVRVCAGLADELQTLYGIEHESVRAARRAIVLARLTS